jgi:WD40 repeat protein
MFLESYNILLLGHVSYMKALDINGNVNNRVNDIPVMGGVRAFTILPCKYFATLSYSKELIKIWNMRSLRCIHVIKSQLYHSTYIVFLKDCRLAISSENKRENIIVWK